jgi:outer membrane lipoprotein-sorting protein
MDPKARELLAQMAEAYKSLKSYSGRVEVKDTQPGANEQHFTIALRKPD